MKSIANTSITIGLITIPVKTFSAFEDTEIRFNYSAQDGSAVEQVYRRIADHRIVGTADDCEKSYEGILIGRANIDAINAQAAIDDNGDDLKQLNISHFVPISTISPLRAQRQYYLGFDPNAKGNITTFATFVKALERRKVAGICKWVVRNKQQIVAIFVKDGRLRAVTLSFAENVRQPNADTDSHLDVKVRRDLLRMMGSVIDAYREPDGSVIDTLADNVRVKRLKLIEDIKAGRKVVISRPLSKAPETVDLGAALEATIARLRAGRKLVEA